MSDKIKARCENCDKNDFQWVTTGGLVNKCEYCSYYYGDGQTPEQRIAELEAENAKLYEALTLAYVKGKSDVDVRKFVKPLQWEYDEDDEIYSAPISPRCRKFLQVSVFCEKMKSGYWRVCTDCIVCDRKTPEEAKEAAQDWLVSLVANACGLEEGK